MTLTPNGNVAERNAPAIVTCKQSFLTGEGSAFRGAFRRVRSCHSVLLSVALFTACAAFVGALYVSSPVQAREIQDAVVPLAAPEIEAMAEVPVRVEESTYLSVIPFETITYTDPDMYVGETAVITEGRIGLRRVTEIFEYTDDGLSSSTAVSSALIVDTVAETIAVGTLEPPATASCGTYIWPAEGAVTSVFGRRARDAGSSNHQGLDIAGKKGASIYAADGGEVILADSSLSGYGLLVQILHDNGDVTYYAHNSVLLVDVGDIVSQGQEIAKMGATGVPSGVHLHFEIRVGGTPVNPADYLP